MSNSIFEAYNDCKKQLAKADLPDCVFEAKQIIKFVTGYSNAQILSNYTETLSEFQKNLLTVIIKQRLARYPLQYILGKWSFFGREYFVGPGVLIPRSDTETLIDLCLEKIGNEQSVEILDLCAGSGCIGITLACERKNANVTLLEKYDEALAYTRKNAEHNAAEVKIVKGDIFNGDCAQEGKYSLIVSNPPYITDGDMNSLQPEVKLEPETALRGGADGLDFYRAIIDNYKDSLVSGGILAFEVGIDGAKAVAELMRKAGLTDIATRPDMNDIERVVFGTAK